MCACVRACVRAYVCVGVYQILASFSSLFAAVTLCTEVFIERRNMQVELIQFRKEISPF